MGSTFLVLQQFVIALVNYKTDPDTKIREERIFYGHSRWQMLLFLSTAVSLKNKSVKGVNRRIKRKVSTFFGKTTNKVFLGINLGDIKKICVFFKDDNY